MRHYLFLHWQSARTALMKIIRQPFGSLLSLAMLALALALPLSLYLTVMSIQEWAGKLTAVPQITLFMEVSAEDADLAAVHGALKQHPKIKNYTFVSKKQALAELEQRNQISGLSDGLEGNPLPDAFIVTPQTLDPKDLQLLEKELSGLPMVAQAQFDARWAQRLYEMVELGKKLVWFLAIAFGVALVLITHNTIRMQILARQEEIEVSKLIGATDSFIRRPFVYHALWQGLLAALTAWGLAYWLTEVANPALQAFASLYSEKFSLRMMTPLELAILLIGSVLLAMIGARLAANHHLRRINPH